MNYFDMALAAIFFGLCFIFGMALAALTIWGMIRLLETLDERWGRG